MTVPVDQDQELELELDRDDAPAVAPERVCKTPGCGQPIPSHASRNRQYCDDHSRHLGVPRSGKRRRGRDKAPRAKPQQHVAAAPAVSTAQIAAMLGEILGIPSLLAQGLWHCDYCAQSIRQQAPRLGHELAVYADSHPWLRSKLELMFVGDAYMGLAMASVAYCLPLLVHHGGVAAPDGVFVIVGAQPPPPLHSAANGAAPTAQAAQDTQGANGAAAAPEPHPFG